MSEPQNTALSDLEPSLQLYTVSASMAADVPGTLQRVADIGFRTVEAFDFIHRPTELRAALDAAGLSARTGHAFFLSEELEFPDGKVTPPPLEQTLEAAATLGLDIVIDPFVAPDQWTSLDAISQTADRLNAAADVAAGYGLRVGYHNHDHELRAMVDGMTGLEQLSQRLDARVALEVDLYWVHAAGRPLADTVRHLGDRVCAVHVKDGSMAPEHLTPIPPTGQVPAGMGEVPLAEAMAAAPTTQYAVIEYDAYDGDIFTAIRASYQWIETFKGGSR